MQGLRDREYLQTPLSRDDKAGRWGLSRGIAFPRGYGEAGVEVRGCFRCLFVVWAAANQQRHQQGVRQGPRLMAGGL